MSLNKYMHPRNRYKFNKPDFKALSELYADFKKFVTVDHKGKLIYDFKNPEAIRVLTVRLLEKDFGFKIEFPPDRLVPTLPLRLNYIHWIEDITNSLKLHRSTNLSGIDIGTGACCIYPILAVSLNPWHFLATEADEVNFTYAKKNLERNNLTDRITVIRVSEGSILESVIGTSIDTYDFCMCNPPFFADHFEAQGLLSRTVNRPEPRTISTASPQECVAEGGEVGFVRKMIEESVYFQQKIRIYSSMLGKKSSLSPLKEVLRKNKVPCFATTEFCQGKTMRWGLAWTFDKSIVFPKSEFEKSKNSPKKSLVHKIATAVGERRQPVHDVVCFLKKVLSTLKIHYQEGKQTKYFALLTLTAKENTWIHSRRKRRQMIRESALTSEMKLSSKEHLSFQNESTETLQSGETISCEVFSQKADQALEDNHLVSENNTSQTSDDIRLVSEHNMSQTSDDIRLVSEYNISQTSNNIRLVSENNMNQTSDEIRQALVAEGKKLQTSDDNWMTSESCNNQPSEDYQKVFEAYKNYIPEDNQLVSEGVQVLPVKDKHLVSEDNHCVFEGNLIQSLRGNHVVPECSEAQTFGVIKTFEDSKILSEVISSGINVLESDLINVDSSEGRKANRKKRKANRKKRKERIKKAIEYSHNSKLSMEEEPPTKCFKQNSMPQSLVKEIAKSSVVQAVSSETSTIVNDTKRASDFILKCHACVHVQGPDLLLKLTWLDGVDLQLLHQLMQFLKNCISTKISSHTIL